MGNVEKKVYMAPDIQVERVMFERGFQMSGHPLFGEVFQTETIQENGEIINPGLVGNYF